MSCTDESTVRNLIARFAQATDLGTVEAYGACLTEDASITIGGKTSAGGRAEMVRGMSERRASGMFGPGSGTLHVTGGSVIEVLGDDARSSTPFLFLTTRSGATEVVGAGRYSDTLRRTADGWRIAARVVIVP